MTDALPMPFEKTLASVQTTGVSGGDIASYIIRPQLARLPGVAIVGVAGGKAREFHVRVARCGCFR